MNQNMKQLQQTITACINSIYADAPLKEDEFRKKASEIRNAMAIGGICSVSDSEFEEILKNLMTSLTVVMEVGSKIIDKNNQHQSWLPSRRANIDFYFWDRYKMYLELDKSWNTLVTSTLGTISDEIVDLLGDPRSDEPFQRRGLILGDVQSGKTANYTAICNKAADTGYRVIIVLAGTMENLRRQTQERLDAEFSGRQSRYFLDPSANKELKNEIVGVGKYDKNHSAVHFTSVTSDFSTNVLKSNNLSLSKLKDDVPVLMVIKKNKKIIENLISWLKANNAGALDAAIDLPMLLIDDEADSASVNTKNEDENPTAINGCIRKLLKLFRQASYLGITATPFANIFINPDSERDMEGEDLFPRDFIYALTPPTNYIGADKIFGDGEHKSFLEPIELEEMDDYLPLNHKKDFKINGKENLLPSLKDALAYFLLANGVLDLRSNAPKHRAMMIHISRFTDVQISIGAAVNEWLAQVKSDLRNFARMNGISDSQDSIKHLKTIWDRFDFADKADTSWESFLKNTLYPAAEPIDVRVINQKSPSKGLDYHSHQSDGLRAIAVGGNSLSRGLTLEGLCVSYFYRKSMMYDTLLQMCRWFGYRTGYEDLVKIWIGREAIDWYGYITDASNELRGEIVKMQKLSQAPKDFGLKVRRSPGALLPTARNKMRATGTIEHPITVSGRLLETPRLKMSDDILKANEDAFRSFVQMLAGADRDNSKKQNFFWTGVDGGDIANLLREFETHPWHLAFQGGALADYIDEHMSGSKWDVVIPEGSTESIFELQCGDEYLNIKPESRYIQADKNQILISGTKVRVGAGGAAAIGLSSEQKKFIDKQYKETHKGKNNVPDNEYLIKGRSPILMLHVVKVNFEKSKITINENANFPEYLFALGLGFPSTGEDTETATYVVNMVELRNYMDPEEDEDE